MTLIISWVQRKRRLLLRRRARLAYLLEALQAASKEWSNHGAAVLIRLHGPQANMPHHLSLPCQASLVVVDGPFVNPYRTLVDAVEFAAKACVRVDGSTTVPPVSILQSVGDGSVTGVPPKVWVWEKATQGHRKRFIRGAVVEGHLDAPPLDVRCPVDALQALDQPLQGIYPKDYASAPDKRPWTVAELQSIVPSAWTMTEWPGCDRSVPPSRVAEMGVLSEPQARLVRPISQQ